MHKTNTRDLTLAAMVAALYAVMSYFGNIFGLTFGPIQLRFSEALCVLPFLFPATVPGLFLGCLIANLLSPYGLLDMLLGPLTTLLAARWTSKTRHAWFAPLPPVLCNALVVGFTLAWTEAGGFSAAFPPAWLYNALTVGLGELASCVLLGGVLLRTLPKLPLFQTLLPTSRSR